MNNCLHLKKRCLYFAFIFLSMIASQITKANTAADAVDATNYIHCTGKDLSATDGLTASCAACSVGTYDWYDAATAGTLLGSGDTFVPTALSGFDLDTEGTFVVYAEHSTCPGTRTPVYWTNVDCNPSGNTCMYLLVLEDSGNDGWEGAYISITENEAATATSHTISVAEGGFKVIPISLADGGILDFFYSQGSKEGEHSFYLLDPLRNIANDATGAPFVFDALVPQGDLPRVKIDCPTGLTCNASTVNAYIHIHMGYYPAEQSWELLGSEGNRIAYANGNTYTGLKADTDIQIPVTLNGCETYTFRAYDGANDSWGGGYWTLFSANNTHGTTLVAPHPFAGYNEIITGPAAFFNDQSEMSFTLPCATTCPDEILGTSFDDTTCEAEAIVPIIQPEVCYPNCNHALGCALTEELILVPYGMAANAFSVVSLNPSTYASPTYTITGVPIGRHDLIYRMTYCDGQISNCTTSILVSSEVEPNIACKSGVIVPLGAPNGIDDNMNNDLTDDLGECYQRVGIYDLLTFTGPCANHAYLEYDLVILDANNVPIVQKNPQGYPIDIFGDPILPGFDTEPAHNIVSTDQIGSELKYQITHLLSGRTCCGTLSVVDHIAPVLTCNDYDVLCTHPDPLNEAYSELEVIRPGGLPANIAGGDALFGASITNIPFEIECGSLGEVIKNFQVHFEADHTDIEDLRITLTPPVATGLPLIELMPYGTCPLFDGAAHNIHVTFSSDAYLSITDPCVAGDPIVNGSLRPTGNVDFAQILGLNLTDAQGTWMLTVMDNDDNGSYDSHAGIGEVTDVEIYLTTGFPDPYQALDCSDLDVELELEMVVDNNCDLSDWVGSTIMRTWRATDIYGNTSSCTQTVRIKAPTFADIELPANQVFNCSEMASTEPSETGGPMFGCYPILDTPEHEAYCDIAITYSDSESSGCNQRIVRTWTMFNWCTLVEQTHIQVIDIVDDGNPIITVEDIEIGTNLFTCDGDIYLNPSITDACSAISQTYLTYEVNGIAYTKEILGATLIENLPLGITSFEVFAKDACGNTATKTFTVFVKDDVEPAAVCDDHVNISLNGSGSARLLASDVNEGSVDNCQLVKMEVRRLDGCLGESTWDNYVDFECCDVGTDVLVELRVTDNVGLTNTCNITVSISESTPPVVVCPADKTITCKDNYTDLAQFGQAEAFDNCEATAAMIDSSIDVDNCGAGILTRTFEATDLQGLTDVCTQTITIESVTGYTVTFPANITVTDCTMAIGDTGEPTLSNDGCGLIAITPSDEIYTVVDEACYKIVRTWTVMDWCIFDSANPNNNPEGTKTADPLTFEDDGDGYFVYEQTIHVLDNIAPVITCADDQLIESNSTACSEQVKISVSAVDNCSDASNFEFRYFIDLDNNASQDVVNVGNAIDYNFGYGTHRIVWEVSDGCGNLSSCEQLITVIDKSAPSVGCINGLAYELNGSGQISIPAADFFLYATDNCDSEADLEATVLMRRAGSADPLMATIPVTCDDIGIVNVEIWVQDNNGNGGFCTTYFDLQDNMSVCTLGPRVAITGHVRTDSNQDVENAMVQIMENNASYATSNDGNFGFNELIMHQNYTVTVSKSTDFLNGVSTADLVYINQHILGINEFDAACQYIAADVNKDNKISTFDMVQLRQLILYVITELPTNDSWRFIDSDYVFPDQKNPWLEAFPEAIHFNNLESDQLHTDFIAVKVGDVNDSAIPNTLLGAEERSDNTLFLAMDAQTVQQGETVCIPFKAKDFKNMHAYQFSLGFDATALTFNDFQAGALSISNHNFGFNMLAEGVITTSWNSNEAINIADEATLFSLCFTAKELTNIEDAIQINSRYTTAEAYNGTDLMDVNLAIGSTTNTTTAAVLYQNTPNPFKEQTNIEFYLPEANTASLRVYNMSGQVLFELNKAFDKGNQRVQLDMKEIAQTGVLFYELTTGSFKATKKMVVIK